MSYTAIGQTVAILEPICPAKTLKATERQNLAVQTLARIQSVTSLARENGVSRKFIHAQTNKAQQALDEAFTTKKNDEQVLFMLPVTKSWLHQLVLALIFVNHSSLRGVVEFLRDVFDLSISLGTVHNIVSQTVPLVRELHEKEDLTAVQIGAHDEIFQGDQPVLVGVDVHSTYCYLLSPSKTRDATTWGAHLLYCQDKGLRPKATVADFGLGLRAGQKEAWPGVPCFGDTFHVLYDLYKVVGYLENRAFGIMATTYKLASQQERSKTKKKDKQLIIRLAASRQEEKRAMKLTDDIVEMTRWMQEDILALVGPDLKTREALYDWIVAELSQREKETAHITPIRRKLENHRAEILGFVVSLEKNLRELSQELQVSYSTVWEVYQLEGLSENNPERYRREEALWKQHGERFPALRQAVKEILAKSVRASSVVENLNSRLRNYFYLRREIGHEYLELLRFFLNHKRFMRSERSERVGRSPAEMMMGGKQAHWLELLGFQLFKRAA